MNKLLVLVMTFLFFLALGSFRADAIDGYVYGTTYFTITLPGNEIINLIAYDKGFNWMKWNWSVEAGVTTTECILSEEAIQIEEFNTTLTIYNRSFLQEDYEYNLTCRGYNAPGGVGSWTEIVESTESVFYRIIRGLEIWKRLLGIEISYRRLVPILYVELMEGI